MHLEFEKKQKQKQGRIVNKDEKDKVKTNRL